ncbi:hypothetical protein QJS04_geneDACA024716 [Acorus gramineus]|uniref:DUF4283 domain-containing protein n=1 Tax=Acorus gramineus TaxID=55184 RepID=A0AAV8ZZG0_ACOGR|nr:hypothetical protein QJS04_geneDACA024716 [Acorus gramineus]
MGNSTAPPPKNGSTIPLQDARSFPPLPKQRGRSRGLERQRPTRGNNKSKSRGPPLPPLVATTPLSWDSLFSKPPTVVRNALVPFCAPEEEDGEKFAEINDEDQALAEEIWSNSIVGYIVGTIPVYTPFLQFLKKLWNPKGDFKLLLKGNGFFLVQFYLEEDLTAVLEGGPWTMANRPFIIQKWHPEVRLEQAKLTSIPIWIKFPTLPLNMWTPIGIGKVASLIGTPLFLDTATRMRTRISFARVCVEVQAGDPLPDFVCVKCNGEKEYLQVLYDWKPTACSVCATYGHNDAMCGRKKSSTHASTKESLVDPRSSNASPIAKVAATLVHKEAPANKSIPSSSNEEPSAKVDASPAHHGVPAAIKAPTNASCNPHQDRQKRNNPSCPHLVQNTQPVKENGKEVQGHQHNPKGVLQEAPTEIFKEVPTQSEEGLSVVLPRTDPCQEALPQKVSSEHSVQQINKQHKKKSKHQSTAFSTTSDEDSSAQTLGEFMGKEKKKKNSSSKKGEKKGGGHHSNRGPHGRAST